MYHVSFISCFGKTRRPYLWVGAVSRLRITLSISSSTSSEGLLELCSAECWLAWYSNRSEDNELWTNCCFCRKNEKISSKVPQSKSQDRVMVNPDLFKMSNTKELLTSDADDLKVHVTSACVEHPM